MSLYTLIIVTFVIFMAINVIIGLRGRKHASTTKDFLTASGQSGIWFIIASAVGASIGSGVVIGTTQYAVKLGVAGAWYAIACGLACVVHAFVMTRFIYRNKLVSFSDYFKRRYDSNFSICTAFPHCGGQRKKSAQTIAIAGFSVIPCRRKRRIFPR